MAELLLLLLVFAFFPLILAAAPLIGLFFLLLVRRINREERAEGGKSGGLMAASEELCRRLEAYRKRLCPEKPKESPETWAFGDPKDPERFTSMCGTYRWLSGSRR